MRILAAALPLLFASIGCSAEYPSCPVETTEDDTPSEQGPEPGHDPAPGPDDPTTPTWPSGDGLADSEGYRRLGGGQICRCDLAEDPLCSRTEPTVRTSDAVCNVKEPEDPDCLGGGLPDGLCDFRNPGDPDCAIEQSPSLCGETFWCCYVIECVGHATKRIGDIPICPLQQGGKMSTRYIAYIIWRDTWVKLDRRALRKEYGTKACYVLELNCREKGGATTCGNYPAD